MYTTIVLGILLRESPLTPIGIGVVAVIVLIMLKFRNKVKPYTNEFKVRWVIMIILVELSTFLTFCFIANVVWAILKLNYNIVLYDTFMAFYMVLVFGIYVGIVYDTDYDKYNSFGLSSTFLISEKNGDYGYKLELDKFYKLKDHFAFKWIRRLAIHSIYPIASFLIYIAVTYKQAPKVGYGIVGVLSVVAFIFYL